MVRSLQLTADGRLPDSAMLDDAGLRRVLEILNPDGEETRLVGGAVRNALLGLPPGDVDLATTLRPEAVMACVKAARLRSIPTGLAHGTVTVMVDARPFEVTTLREDVETDGRHATVRFGRDFEADARRRDFTMNALSAGLDGCLFDPVRGIDDLAAGRVRFIGDAATRIREDYLRILRFFRFHATYGLGALDSDGLAAVVGNRDGLRRLSRERIRAEFLKILAAPNVVDVLRTMEAAGILSLIFGHDANVERLAGLVVLEAGADPLLRLAALALREPADADLLRERLRLSNAELIRLQGAARAVAQLGRREAPPDPTALRKLLFDYGPQASTDAVRLCGAETHINVGAWRDASTWLSQAEVPRLPFSGADLTSRGFEGPAVGAALAALREAWARAGFPVDPSLVGALLDNIARDVGGAGNGSARNVHPSS